jgi:hypothetical protein
VGQKLMRHVSGLLDYDLDDDEREACLHQLGALLEAGDDAGVWRWFRQELPRCMAMVPMRRRRQFLKGVRAVYEQNPNLLTE